MGENKFSSRLDPKLAGQIKINLRFEDLTLKIKGDADKVTEIFAAVCRTDAVEEGMRRCFEGMTREEIAESMRQGGWPENVVQEFETGEFWPDLIS